MLIKWLASAFLALCVGFTALVPSLAAQGLRLDANDTAYLWPAPVTAAEVDQLIPGNELLEAPDSQLWPRADFELLLRTAQSTIVSSSAGSSFGIRFAESAEQFGRPETWKVVAFRVDASAPGSDPALISQFGSTPQIRLVLQPVTTEKGVARVHDVTAHLAYSFITGVDPQTHIPSADKAAFTDIVRDLTALKMQAGTVGATTEGPLRVHPGLQAHSPAFAASVRQFLKHHLSQGRLTAMAFMGIDPPEPWIFFAMVRRADDVFVQAGSPQMLTFRGGSNVFPVPRTTNIDSQNGVSTAVLFGDDANSLMASPAIPGAARPLRGAIPDIIANPRLANVLNTDCVSCHTESRRRLALSLHTTDQTVAFQRPANVSDVDPSLLPQNDWNVRNFGWFPGRDGRVQPTITMRTSNEIADAVEFINAEYLGVPRPARTHAPIITSNLNAPGGRAVASPLTLVMNIKSPEGFARLSGLIKGIQAMPPEQNPIAKALTELSTVHFARFVFLNERQLAVITDYDGSFDDYIDAFVNALGPVFDQLLVHMTDAPLLPVSDHREEFLEYVRKNDLGAIPPFYSAYPNLKVQDILTLDKKRQ